MSVWSRGHVPLLLLLSFSIIIYVSICILAVLGGWSPISRFVFLVVLAHFPYLGILFIYYKRPMLFASSISVFGVALGLRLFLVFAPPVFSDDIYRYIWDGRIMNEGINPYRYAPTDNELEAFRNKSWERINHPELKTIYPPLAQLYFAIVTKISHSETGFKIAASITDAFLVFFIIYLAKGRLRLKNQNEYF